MKAMLKDPYRIFFPLGFMYFLLGAGIWFLTPFIDGFYPVQTHRYLIYNGFLFCFIPGFLFTALPRFAGSDYLRIHELSLYLIVTLGGATLLNLPELLPLVTVFQSLIILGFIICRLGRRTQNPPYSFVFILLGVFFNFLIGAFKLGNIESSLSGQYFLPVALIIMGVGSRLIPGILGHVEVVKQQRAQYEQKMNWFKTIPYSVWGILIGLVLLPCVEASIGAYLLAGFGLVWGFNYLRLYRLPNNRTALTYNLWICSWVLVLGLFIRLIDPGFPIHLEHSLFIGCFTLISFLIATRVLQAHGSQDKSTENSKTLYIVSIIILISMATRVLAFYVGDHYENHLAYASVLLVISGIIWGVKYLPELNKGMTT